MLAKVTHESEIVCVIGIEFNYSSKYSADKYQWCIFLEKKIVLIRTVPPPDSKWSSDELKTVGIHWGISKLTWHWKKAWKGHDFKNNGFRLE